MSPRVFIARHTSSVLKSIRVFNPIRTKSQRENSIHHNKIERHYCRMLLTRHHDQRPFDETVCDAIIANDVVKKPSKKVQNVCDGGHIKHGSDFSYVCDVGHRLIQ